MNRTPNRVYVKQYGTYWSLSAKQWAGLVAATATDPSGGYDLSPYRQLGKRPESVSPDTTNPETGVRSKGAAMWADVELHTPLDWTAEDWTAEHQRTKAWL